MAVGGRYLDAAKSLCRHSLKVFEPFRSRKKMARVRIDKLSVRELIFPLDVESPPPKSVFPGDLYCD